MSREDVARCLMRVPVIPGNVLEQVGLNPIVVHASNDVTEELMRRKPSVGFPVAPRDFEMVTVKRIRMRPENKNDVIQRFVKEVTILKILSGQESFPSFYGVTYHQPDDLLPGIVKGYVGDPTTARYLTLSEPLKLWNRTLLPLATEADWLCVALYISHVIERLHQQSLAFGKTREEELGLDFSGLSTPNGQLSAFLVDFGKIEFTMLDKACSDGTRGAFADDVCAFGEIISNIGESRDVPFLISLGEICSHKDPRKRPSLAEVIKTIEKAYALQMLEGWISQS